MSSSPHITVEIMSLTPKLREDLTITMQTFRGETCYLIEDPFRSSFYRVGLTEYTFLSMLDGSMTLAEVVARTAALMGERAIDEQEAVMLSKWLVDSELVTTRESMGSERLSDLAATASTNRVKSALNPIFQRLPLIHPDTWLNQFQWLARTLFNPVAAVLWTLTLIGGATCLFSNWDAFATSASDVVAPSNWIWLLVTWLSLKVVHELAHALACKRFGCRVREAGVMFVLFMPLPYVDVTSAWRLSSKWQRMMISAAGVYAELLIAALAAVCWCSTSNELARQHLSNVVITASIVTLVFNANPLMRFDGYHLLSDFLEMPNLATHGSQFSRYLFRKWVFGETVEKPEWPEGRATLIVVYAIAASMWRVVISASLIVGASMLFYGAGVVLAAAAICLWFVFPIATTFISLVVGKSRTNIDRRWFVGVLIGCVTAGLLLWFAVPWYSRVRVPTIVTFDDVTEIRSASSGFVAEVLTETGDEVDRGDVLVRLRNRELDMQINELQIEVEQAERRASLLRYQHSTAAVQVAAHQAEALKEKLGELTSERDSLVVCSPSSGIVMSAIDTHDVQTWVTPGQQLVTIAAPSSRCLKGLVSQRQHDAIACRVGTAMRSHVWGDGAGATTATLADVQPRASLDVRHIALTAASNGPLPVRPLTTKASAEEQRPRWELIEPHFEATFTLSEDEASAAGRTGFVDVWHYHGQVGPVLWSMCREWLERRTGSTPLNF